MQVELEGSQHRWSLDREMLIACTAALTERTLAAVRRVLRDARLAPAEIAGVVMVGGSTRMPAVQQAAQAFFGKPPLNKNRKMIFNMHLITM